MLHRYHSLVPLEDDSANQARDRAKVFGYPTALYKATSTADGIVYAIRRVEGHRVTSEYALAAGDMWRSIQHPTIVALRDIFLSKEFGDVNCMYLLQSMSSCDQYSLITALYFVYDYHAGAETLEQRLTMGYVSEPVMWSYISQLLGAVRTIHAAGLVYNNLSS
jgi:PAB-dependent poly(A)-specific ribonuclease subunit 3